MSLLPYVVSSVLDDYDPYYNRLYDQNFGLGLFNDDMFVRPWSLTGLATPLHSGYLRALRHLQPEESGVSTVSNKKDEFKVTLDVQQFKPNEIKVKVVDDYVVVEGKHEEREDKHGYISREFRRKYRLPPNVKADAITSNLSSDGLLSIQCPKKVRLRKHNSINTIRMHDANRVCVFRSKLSNRRNVKSKLLKPRNRLSKRRKVETSPRKWKRKCDSVD